MPLLHDSEDVKSRHERIAQIDARVRDPRGNVGIGREMPDFRDRAEVGVRIEAGSEGVEIGKIDASRADRVLNAEGHIVAPGFIDVHTHYDAQLYWDPYCTMSGWHGVTSVVIGNCGFGFAPCAPDQRDRAMKSMTRVEAIPLAAMESALPWDWLSFPEFLDSVERIPKSVNVLSYVVGLGENDAVTPLGKPDTERFTLPANPYWEVT